MEKTYSLNGEGWQLCFYDSLPDKHNTPKEDTATCISATVPGNVELDLAAAGLLPEDIFKGMHTRLAEQYETYTFVYSTTFRSPLVREDERVLLCFEGVDCLAEYTLNGRLLGKSANAFMPFQWDITDILTENNGENKLSVCISSALLYTLAVKYDQFTLHGSVINGANYLRKPAHSYGWDIFPRLLTAGLWKDVSLHIQPAVRIGELCYHSLGENSVELTATVEAPASYFLDRGKLVLRVEGHCGSSSFSAEQQLWRQNTVRFSVSPEDVKLWWPYGYGEPNLYKTTFMLYYDGTLSDTREMNIGFRTAQLKRSASLSEENPQFVFSINGTDVFAKGSNWVPLDALHSRDKGRYERALALVSEAGCNMLRVWGGGVYEQDVFYDYCDSHGIMIWQDFMMGCQVPPTEPEMMRNLTDEFTWVIKALRNHASLVLWAGDNENDQGFSDKGMNPDRNPITRKLIPELLHLHDPFRDYLPSSPYIDSANFARRYQSNILPEMHLWGPRDYYKSSFYRDSQAVFVSETGYHGCPSPASLAKMLDADALWPYTNEQWTLHSSDCYENDWRIRMMAMQVQQLFGEIPDNPEDFSFASQISQAEAFKYFIERMRVALPKRGGILWWNLLDGWPQISDAVVDYYFDKKLAFYYIKTSQQPFCLMMDELAYWGCSLVAANDTRETVTCSYDVRDAVTDTLLLSGTATLAPLETARIDKADICYSDKIFLIIHWQIDGKDFYNHFLSAFPPVPLTEYRSFLEKLRPLQPELFQL